MLFEAQGCPMLAEHDSVLLFDPDLDDNLNDNSEPGKANHIVNSSSSADNELFLQHL